MGDFNRSPIFMYICAKIRVEFYSNLVYEVMEKPEVIDAKALVEATRETKCSYIVLSEERKIDGDLVKMGLKLVNTLHGYNIYADPEVLNAGL